MTTYRKECRKTQLEKDAVLFTIFSQPNIGLPRVISVRPDGITHAVNNINKAGEIRLALFVKEELKDVIMHLNRAYKSIYTIHEFEVPEIHLSPYERAHERGDNWEI